MYCMLCEHSDVIANCSLCPCSYIFLCINLPFIQRFKVEQLQLFCFLSLHLKSLLERPMIIHNCKFDIRQWFLLTSVQPLVIWMYKESYLRFSSQEYDLVNFHESVHLTNHAVQKRYVNGKRDERLPRENMW